MNRRFIKYSFFIFFYIGWFLRLRLLGKQLILFLQQLNIFKNDDDDEINDRQRDGTIATRFYILILITILVIIAFYTSINNHTELVTISFLSQSIFEQLSEQYSQTLVCPCTQITMARKEFIDIQPIFHQVLIRYKLFFIYINTFISLFSKICSSVFIQPIWLEYFNLQQNTGEDTISIWLFDFRIAGATFFGLLTQLCTLANETISQAWQVYGNNELTTGRTLSRNEFNAQINVLVNEFQSQTPANFHLLVDLVKNSIEGNQLLSFFATNARPIEILPTDWQQEIANG